MNAPATQVLNEAIQTSEQLTNWADISNALFDPEQGLLARAYPNADDRKAFIQTDEYKAIRQIVSDAMKRSGVIDGANPEKSGKFVVRLPKTLHGALEQEANREGVSLNQLVVTKLAVKLSQIADGPKSHLAGVAQAYLETRKRMSADRVIADPELDAMYLHRCRELGLSGTDYELNWMLMDARKNSYLKDMPKTKKYTPRRIDDFEFASEMALAHMRSKLASDFPNGLSLDRIICDPLLAREFDKIASELAPDFTPLEYRWAALGVRKAAGRYAKQAEGADLVDFERLGSTKGVRASQIPEAPGIYIFRNDNSSLFIGETDNLRSRISRHFDSSGNQGIPDWIYEGKRLPLDLGIVAMSKKTKVLRKISELRAISEFHPALNYSGSAA